jgi:hypothetical protein
MRAISCEGLPEISSLPNMIFPDLAERIPEMTLSAVDLPAPFAPMSETISPLSTRMDTFRKAGRLP